MKTLITKKQETYSLRKHLLLFRTGFSLRYLLLTCYLLATYAVKHSTSQELSQLPNLR